MIGRSNQRCTAVIGEESSPVPASARGICWSTSGPSSLPSCFQETAETTWSKRQRDPSPGTMPRKRLPSTSNRSIRAAQVDLHAPAGEPGTGALPDFTQRYPRHDDLICLARGHEPIDENFSRRRHRHMVERVAQGAFQHHGPEPSHGVLRLLLAAEPLAHGGRVGSVGVVMTGQSQHGPADGPALDDWQGIRAAAVRA